MKREVCVPSRAKMLFGFVVVIFFLQIGVQRSVTSAQLKLSSRGPRSSHETQELLKVLFGTCVVQVLHTVHTDLSSH